jgi:hypothetical protein
LIPKYNIPISVIVNHVIFFFKLFNYNALLDLLVPKAVVAIVLVLAKVKPPYHGKVDPNQGGK